MTTVLRMPGTRPVPGAAAFANNRLEERRLNPARSLGPALVSGDLGRAWIYVAGPLAGALLAVALAWALRGPPSPAADMAAQGSSAPAHRVS